MSNPAISEEALFADLANLPISHLTLSHTPIAPDTVLTAEEFFLLAHAEWQSEEASFFHSLISSSDTAPLLSWLADGHDVNTRDSNNLTLLLYALRHCASIEVVEELLKAGADPNLPDPNGVTPLMWAADVNAPVEVITALIDAGAEVNAHAHEDYVSAIALAALSRTPKPATILTLLKAGAKMPSGIFNLLADDPNAPKFPDFEYMYFDFIESKSVPSYLVDPDYPRHECPIYEHFYVSNGPRPEPQYTYDGYHLIDPIPDDTEPQPTEANADPAHEPNSDESQLLTTQNETALEHPEMAEAIFKNFPKPIADVVFPCTNATTASKTRPASKPVSNPVPPFVPRSRRRRTAKGQILLEPSSLPLTPSFINCRNRHVPPKKYHDPFLYLATGAALMFVSLIFIVVACV